VLAVWGKTKNYFSSFPGGLRTRRASVWKHKNLLIVNGFRAQGNVPSMIFYYKFS